MPAMSVRPKNAQSAEVYYHVLVSLVLVPLGCAAVAAGWMLFAMLALRLSGGSVPTSLPDGYFLLPLVVGGLLFLPMYRLSQRLNACRVMLTLLLLQWSLLAWLGAAQHRWEFLLIGVVLGVTSGIVSAGIAHIYAWAPQCRSGVVVGVYGAIMAGGGLAWLLVPIISLAYSWRIAVWSLMLPVFMVIFLLWLFIEPDAGRI